MRTVLGQLVGVVAALVLRAAVGHEPRHHLRLSGGVVAPRRGVQRGGPGVRRRGRPNPLRPSIVRRPARVRIRHEFLVRRHEGRVPAIGRRPVDEVLRLRELARVRRRLEQEDGPDLLR